MPRADASPGGPGEAREQASGSPLEIGSEVLAADFIWPEREFLSLVQEQGVGDAWRPEDVCS